ncbi:hypothetical protein BGLT_03592 [Caballeronia glathei]|uniref:Uncharacterized protein n=1 Tax=Caballeronia glathei TaxID=60547 RepID=A0A069PI54_9BURK|nr:hypothetical protein [Caballeronia glathei]KDR40270.1 hypothetical protein BG61_26585 [Caballeronia glathei]CDY74650.1 hypothetical protein BGLT_03592 [Caballeronia glathei]
MQSENYEGYSIWDPRKQADILQLKRYAGSGTITRNNRLIEASGVLDLFDTEEEAQYAGLSWARACVDNHR